MRPTFLDQPDLHPAHRTPRVRQSPARYGDPIEHYVRPGLPWRRLTIAVLLLISIACTVAAILGVTP